MVEVVQGLSAASLVWGSVDGAAQSQVSGSSSGVGAGREESLSFLFITWCSNYEPLGTSSYLRH